MFEAFTPDTLRRALRDPFTLASLFVDLIPVFGVLFLGWGAAPLVILYWFENVLIGIATIPRIILASFFGAERQPVSGVFMSVFFTFHYGLFTVVHGVFVFAMVGGAFGGGDRTEEALDLGLDGTASPFEQVWAFAAIYIAWHIIAFVLHDVIGRSYRDSTANKEMFAPYGRIVVLHIAILGGAVLAIALGDPLIGALALILLKTAWTLVQSLFRIKLLDTEAASIKS